MGCRQKWRRPSPKKYFLINHNYRLNSLPHKNLEVMPSFDPLENPPNWNASKYGIGGYWEWNPTRKRTNGEIGSWEWYDNPDELAAYMEQKHQVQKTKKGLTFKKTDLWIMGSVTFATGMILGIILKELIKG